MTLAAGMVMECIEKGGRKETGRIWKACSYYRIN